MQSLNSTFYPGFIRNLPQIETPLDGVRGWLLQGESTQTVFFDIQPTAEVPPHSHCAQWGVMLDGEMKLTIADETRLVRKGESYLIPAGVTHSAVFLTRVQVMDIFDDPKRYKAK